MPDMQPLNDWGWDEHYANSLAALEPGARASPARVIGQDRDRWSVRLGAGVATARLASASFAGPYPVTGDWVVVEPGPAPSDPLSLTAVLPRRSAISRGAPGTRLAEQVLAANVDVVWILHALDSPPNVRRLERYVAAAWESGAVPQIVLTKADLVAAPELVASEVAAVVIGVAVHTVSTRHPASIDELKGRLEPRRTYALLGPSGAGKSSLLNALADAALAATGEVREFDGKGRHTTTRRELFRLSGGSLLMDTPGLRELRIWLVDDGLSQTFPEIAALAASCRFRDCGHVSEPGCAVIAAVDKGALDPERLASFHKLRAEAAYLERKFDPEANAAAVSRHKTAMKTLKYHPKYRRED
jgi:ribosome biogenesis GTPase / thiamine phosphate phosphatase